MEGRHWSVSHPVGELAGSALICLSECVRHWLASAGSWHCCQVWIYRPVCTRWWQEGWPVFLLAICVGLTTCYRNPQHTAAATDLLLPVSPLPMPCWWRQVLQWDLIMGSLTCHQLL